ncbi:MAG: OmpH family outer membrane protein [Flammeovirgaceae bacterium]|nr:OmpH family outer membrane protein [Flammeovirgaceae bacterium]
MKNLSLILNGILLVAVGVLFYLHFSGNDADASTPGSNSLPSDIKVAYVNADSLVKHYEYVKDNRVTLEAKGKKLEQDYRNRAQGLQNEISNYQRNVSNLTIGQARAVEEDLAKKQQNLQLYEQSLTQELMNDEGKMKEELYNRVTSYLKKYGEEKGLHAVLKLDPSSDLLYGNSVLDITTDVLAGLNEAYKTEKNAPAQADSTAVKK